MIFIWLKIQTLANFFSELHFFHGSTFGKPWSQEQALALGKKQPELWL